MRPFLAPVLLLAVLPAVAQTPAMSSYRNDTLRLSYAYPSNYVDASSMVQPAFEASVGGTSGVPAEAKCITLPFSRMQAGTGQIGILTLARADSGCLKKKFNAKAVGEIAQGAAQGLAASGARISFGEPVNFEVAGRPAALLQGNFALPTGQSMQAMVVCVLDQPDIACWQFLSNNTLGLSTMAAFPVTFDGSPATPLVPQNVLTAPQK